MEDYIKYNKLIDTAMREVVRMSLKSVQANGFLGNHHFLISFLTYVEGVEISLLLKEKYPEEMTIVIQHQYEDLEVRENDFSIVLHFNGVKESVTVPFSALTSFADPGVKFALKFNILSSSDDDIDELEEIFRKELEKEKKNVPVEKEKKEKKNNTKKQPKNDKNIVKLSDFRKK